ncbi:hypothetical protein [Aureivirga sp. CE67]|uniref:hypothetical protein n=1 Tax=Aureivirga sp. CE67 TaxID=1788983 RepID=UPI0018CB622F|nr:hypothetical protein [Aureivirga sp. CE67]
MKKKPINSKNSFITLTDKLTYKDQIFENYIKETNFKTEGQISFENCTFKKVVAFEDIQAYSISFLNCTFHQDFFLSDSEFNNIYFTICKFKNCSLYKNKCFIDTNFNYVNAINIDLNGIYNNLSFKKINVRNIKLIDVNNEYSFEEQKIEFNDDENIVEDLKFKSSSNYSQICFTEGIYNSIWFDGFFNDKLNFNGNIKNQNLYFHSSTFNDRIDFNEGNFDNISFNQSSFKGLILIYGIDVLTKKSKNLLIDDLAIHSCQFEKDFSVYIKEIKYLNLSNNNFEKAFSLNSDKKNENYTSFSLDGFNQGNVIIENIYIDITFSGINTGNLYFKDMIIENLIIRGFHNKGDILFTKLISKYDLVIQDSIVGNLNFFNEDINYFEEIIISNSNLKGLILNKYPKKIRSYSSNPLKGYGSKKYSNRNLKNIYSQLKIIAKTNGDIDHMNKFKSLEFKKMVIIKSLSFDSIILFLNWISNNNGNSWFRGVLFTLSIGYLFFSLYINNLNLNLSQNTLIENYILFISSFPKLELEKYSELNKQWDVSLIIWISRIFISYGIYQTITAFRKYGKI